MSKLNEANILEGIFAIIVGSTLAQGRPDRSLINSTRSLVEPFMFSSGKFNGSIVENAKRERGSNPPDYFSVQLNLVLSPLDKQTNLYGKEYSMLYDSSREIGFLNEKINELIDQVQPSKSKQMMSLLKQRDEFLNNKEQEDVTFIVTADGGNIQFRQTELFGSINISVNAESDGSSENVMNQSMFFNVQTRMEEPNKLRPYEAIVEIANTFGAPFKKIDKYNFIKQKTDTPVENNMKYNLYKKMLRELSIDMSQNKINISKRAISFLESVIFGGFLNDVIEVRRNTLIGVGPDIFGKMNGNMNVSVNGNEFVFKDSRYPLFRMRFEFRQIPAEVKFTLEGISHGLDRIRNK